MYVILVNDDNTLSTPKKQRIVQRSKLVDDFWILVNPIYNGRDLTDCTVVLEYVKPVSNEYKTEILVKSEEGYEEYLKYILPVDTEFTKEAGSLKMQLSFVYVDIDADGNHVQCVRKTSPALKVEIIPIEEWFNVIPDSALSAVDQRIIKQDAQIKMMADLVGTMSNNMVDDIKYNEEDETLQLQSGGFGVGSKVSVRDMLDEGVPVVDMDSASGDGSGSGSENDSDTNHGNNCNCGCNCEDDVVEFGYSETTNTTDDSDVVEF